MAFHHEVTAGVFAATSRNTPFLRQLRMSGLFSIFAIALLLQSCASTTVSSGPEQALVCPRCKTVETVAWLPAGPSFSRAGVSAYGVNGLYPSPSFKKHECPGCRGAMTTFARQGKWEHRCSICQQGTFSCPIIHPTESAGVRTGKVGQTYMQEMTKNGEQL